jgi:hypothetical protein
MELIRRLALTVLICSAAWLFFYTPLSPLVRVKPVDFAAEFKKESQRPGRTSGSLLPYGSNAPANYEQYVADKTEGKVLKVKGREWDTIFQHTGAAKNNTGASENMQRRTSPQYRGAGFYFYASEAPFNTLKDRLNKHLDTLYLLNNDGQYLKADYKAYSYSSFQIGSGLSDYPDPPSWLMYPYRKYVLWIILAAIVFYILLPKKKKDKDSIHFKTWFIAGNDISFAVLLIVPPFIAPMAIMGGAAQVFFTEGIFLLPVFWLIALIGIWGLVFIMPRFAAFEIKMTSDGIKAVDVRGEKFYRFKDMEYFQWITFKRPRWMIFLAWIFLLAGRRGGISFFVLSTLTHAGIGIGLKEGILFYINTSNPMGQSVLNQKAGQIAEILMSKGVVEKEGETVIRTMGLEPAGIKSRDKRDLS